MSKWGTNSRKQAAQDRKNEKKEIEQAIKQKAKDDAEWKVTDKAELRALEKKKATEEKKLNEAERKAENKKLYEEDMASIQSNKKAGATSNRLTRAQIEANKKKMMLKSLAKNMPQYSSSEDEDSDPEEGPYYQRLKPNKNHELRDAEGDDSQYAEVIDVSGLNNALNALEDADKHPERRAKAAYQRYLEEQMPIVKLDQPGLKRSQYLEIIQKNWKKAPENPFNQKTLEFNEKKH